MIGLAGEDRHRPVDLFGQHCARERVRPGLRPERELLGGGGQDRPVEPVRAADRERDPALAAIPERAEMLGERARRRLPTATVAGYEPRARRARQDRLGFARGAGASALDLEDLDRGDLERATGGLGPLGPSPGELRLGRVAQSSDADQGDAQVS